MSHGLLCRAGELAKTSVLTHTGAKNDLGSRTCCFVLGEP